MNDAFVDVDDWVPGIRWDAKYATWDNFTGEPLDGYRANRVVDRGCRPRAAESPDGQFRRDPQTVGPPAT